MPEVGISESGGLFKDFLVIMIGAMIGAAIVYVWDITAGRALANAVPGGVQTIG